MRGGFALIVTMSLLILLVILGVGMLSLSVISMRSGAGSAAQAEARANARLALLLAIGELQKEAGADQRITANAGILDDSPESEKVDGVKHPHWTGVWDSWAAGGQKFGSDSASEHQTIYRSRNRGMAPSYEEGREDHFRAWLVSLADADAEVLDSAKNLDLDDDLMPAGSSSGVRLVGEGSLGVDTEDEEFVAAGLREVNPGQTGGGRYAWWVADESTKARILPDSFQTGNALANAEVIDRVQSAGSTGHEALAALEDLSEPAVIEKMYSRHTMEIPADDREAVRATFHAVTPYSLGLMTDVREGGMKRDLSALLERPINIRDNDDEFMLYRLDCGDDARVPIQDLAAYYQSYREVVDYSGRSANNRYARSTLQVNNVDFRSGHESIAGKVGAPERSFVREYTNLYRMPFPVKVQFLLSYKGVARTGLTAQQKKENPDKYKLHVGITPALTMWNPYNLPLVLNTGENQATQLRLFNIPFGLTWKKNGGEFTSPKPNSLVWLTNRNQEDWRNDHGNTVARNSDRDNGVTLYVGGLRNHVIFQPGEVRVFSLRRQQSGRGGYQGILNRNRYSQDREADPGWDPNFFLELTRSEESSNKQHVELEYPGTTDARLRDGGSLTFDAGDKISLTVTAAEAEDMANGAAFHFFHRQSSTMFGGLNSGADKSHMRRQYQLTSRLHKDSEYKKDNSFNESLLRQGFPGGANQIQIPAINGSELIGRHRPFLLVSMTAGCEVSQEVAGEFRGRRFASRPFLHSTPVQTVTWLDRDDPDAYYQHGWNWWIQDINSVFEATVQVAANNRSSFWGGGYTPEFGSTNIVQQEVPLTPVHSIAALSHAQLSGYSISQDNLGTTAGGRVDNFEGTTATGGNGLFPRISQAIGNSYAHPYLRAYEASGTWTRHYNVSEGEETIPFADHSYLANKALWDDYFFSSIAPRRTRIFSGAEQGTARQVAERFFTEGADLPNRRFVPYLSGFEESDLGRYFKGADVNLEGADEIASLMMVKGPFNVNSTSVDAWRALFSSLREREVGYLSTNDNANRLGRGVPIEKTTAEGVAVAGTTIGNGELVEGSSRDPADPEQWYCWRQLTDDEIQQLAVAMVKQVKLRGPFLSLSEFVNRRLDRGELDLSVKGALQAALDDEDVDINEGFRNGIRQLSDSEIGKLRPKFRQAMEGPVAYGSAAYVDQADILRSFGAQLTPRGDTFLIRSYGDAVGPDGQVRARAWCEAVVQRVPEYLDPAADDPHLSFPELSSEANKEFGRPYRLVAFRWLDADEV